MWISCFEDTAAVVLGCDSEKLGQLKERDPEAFDKVFSDGTFKQFSFRIRAKTETFNVKKFHFSLDFTYFYYYWFLTASGRKSSEVYGCDSQSSRLRRIRKVPAEGDCQARSERFHLTFV